MISSRPANDLAVDVRVEHAAFVSCANILLTALGENKGILKEDNKSCREVAWNKHFPAAFYYIGWPGFCVI